MIQLLKFMKKNDFLYMFINVMVETHFPLERQVIYFFKSAFNFIPDWFMTWTTWKNLASLALKLGIRTKTID